MNPHATTLGTPASSPGTTASATPRPFAARYGLLLAIAALVLVVALPNPPGLPIAGQYMLGILSVVTRFDVPMFTYGDGRPWRSVSKKRRRDDADGVAVLKRVVRRVDHRRARERGDDAGRRFERIDRDKSDEFGRRSGIQSAR